MTVSIKILLIAILIFAGFLIAFIYAYIKDKKSGKEMGKLSEKLKDLAISIKNIGMIQPAGANSFNSIVSSTYIALENLSRLYKYTQNENEYWIEFVLKNASSENLTFSLTGVVANINDLKIDCSQILLLEKVPEYFAPP